MTKDGPNDEISFGLDVTPTSVTGKAKGRAISIVHRWLGSAMGKSIARNNRAAARERLLGSLEQEAIKEVGEQALAKLRNNPDAVDAVLEAIAPPGMVRRHENTQAVFEKALEDLRVNPPTEAQASSGSEDITPEIADRLENYAAGASTEEVRERWGRVLAAEIRQPGTFSLKVLRIIDELDDRLPEVFERLAADRIVSDCIPRCLSGLLDYTDQIDLIDAGLLHDPGSAGEYQFRYFGTGTERDSEQQEPNPIWTFATETGTVTFSNQGPFTNHSQDGLGPITSDDGRPGMPAYLLTMAGAAITSILPPVDNSKRYLSKLREIIPAARLWVKSGTPPHWVEHDPITIALETTGSDPSD